MPIRSYRNLVSRDIAESVKSKGARRLLPITLHRSAIRILAALDAMTSLNELIAFPGWRLEKLRGNRNGQYSLRINRQYRVCFNWDGKDVSDVEIVDYH